MALAALESVAAAVSAVAWWAMLPLVTVWVRQSKPHCAPLGLSVSVLFIWLIPDEVVEAEKVRCTPEAHEAEGRAQMEKSRQNTLRGQQD